jgi:hypothetical protein
MSFIFELYQGTGTGQPGPSVRLKTNKQRSSPTLTVDLIQRRPGGATTKHFEHTTRRTNPGKGS